MVGWPVACSLDLNFPDGEVLGIVPTLNPERDAVITAHVAAHKQALAA